MNRELIKRAVGVACTGVLAAGCAGLEITTITHNDVEQSRTSKDKALDGYVLYEPMVVVEISPKVICLQEKDKDGNCVGKFIIQCAAGTPFTLPNHARPYLVRSKSGFGKAGVEVAITDGWKLGNIKDNSDNTALLGPIAKLLGIQMESLMADKNQTNCDVAGLYQVTTKGAIPELTRLILYPK